jgi:hypothetical protein
MRLSTQRHNAETLFDAKAEAVWFSLDADGGVAVAWAPERRRVDWPTSSSWERDRYRTAVLH